MPGITYGLPMERLTLETQTLYAELMERLEGLNIAEDRICRIKPCCGWMMHGGNGE